jgi:UMF1 family MFS transporter
MQPNPKKLHRAWSMYDWANSAYNLVITSTIFPAYYDAISATKDVSGKVINNDVMFLGHKIGSAALYTYAIAFAYLVIAIASPILSSVADYKGNKKSFMKFFCYMGSLACCALFFFTKDTLSLGILCCIIAAIGYCGSLVFYNAYLPEIAIESEQDKVSAQGFAYGYFGSVILQVICFVFVLAQPFNMTVGFASRLSFLLVGLWWMGFAQIPFAVLPKNKKVNEKSDINIFSKGFIELKKVWQQVKKLPVLRNYLGAFFFYSMGVQTVMLAATLFGSQVLHLAESKLIICILLIQIVAIAGSYLMAQLSSILGNIRVLMITVVIWMAICVIAYFITNDIGFYIVAILVGFVMGGIQSLSRSTYSKLMPETQDTTSFFSFYDVTEKIAIVIGMFSFGLIEHVTGNMRNSIFALTIFFALGFIFLLVSRSKQRKAEVQPELA